MSAAEVGNFAFITISAFSGLFLLYAGIWLFSSALSGYTKYRDSDYLLIIFPAMSGFVGSFLILFYSLSGMLAQTTPYLVLGTFAVVGIAVFLSKNTRSVNFVPNRGVD